MNQRDYMAFRNLDALFLNCSAFLGVFKLLMNVIHMPWLFFYVANSFVSLSLH